MVNSKLKNMFKMIIKQKGLWRILLLCLAVLSACSDRTIVPMDYEEGRLYLPAAIYGNYNINALSQAPLTPNPTPGYAVRYTLDKDANQFEIPLAVYRGGISNPNAATVSISIYSDTIAQMIAAENLPDTVQLLPADKYAMPASVNLAGGQTVAPFALDVDFDFLVQTSPALYALPVRIDCADQPCNPSLSTAIIVIDSRMVKPAPVFAYEPVRGDTKSFTFHNRSLYAIDFSWDFGDGQTAKDNDPTHTYAAPGDYTVTLTASGLCDGTISASQIVTAQ